jgi:hypothetical protein
MKLNFTENSLSAKRSGPKSGAQTPAAPSERRKGSDKNKKGSSSKDGGKITFSEQVTNALKNKVAEHNKKYSKKVSLSQLKKVYRRGAGAFSSSHRANMTRGQWAMARVNTFLKMMRGGKVKDSYRAADQDLAKGSVDENNTVDFFEFDELELALAKVDIVKYGISNNEADFDIEDLEYSEAEKKTLNKPFRLPTGSNKKFGVYVKNPKTGNTFMVKFGDPNMEIKRDDPNRRKNFRARHNCDTAKDKTTPRYWSCKFWSSKPVSSLASTEEVEGYWDDSSFEEQETILAQNKELDFISIFVEQEDI